MRNARSTAVRVAFWKQLENGGTTCKWLRHTWTKVRISDKLQVGDIIETIDGKSPGNDESFEELKDYLAGLEPDIRLVLSSETIMTISAPLKMDSRTGGI